MAEPIVPNCVIMLHFYEAPTRFAFHCTAASEGWRVQPDGSIHPPSKQRVVEFRLSGFPNPDVRFAGLQVSTTGDFTPTPHWMPQTAQPPAQSLSNLGVTVLAPTTYPPPPDANGIRATAGPLTLRFETPPATGSPPPSRLFYRLAVVIGQGTVLHWHDPKIYDDGSE